MFIALAVLGLVVGCFGTLIGAGGGFLLVPVLVLLYPDDSPATIASISLAVVFCNALSGTIAYTRQRRTDVRAGLWFSATAIPGAVLGAIVVNTIPRTAFEAILGVVLVGAAVFLFLSKPRAVASQASKGDDLFGPRVEYPHALGLALSFAVGFVSSLLGIGGGIIHVPALVHALGFPVHVATATSHFVLATTAGAGTLTHIATGAFHEGWRRTIALAVGAVVGAQLGAYWARHARPTFILRGLAIALILVGVRILVHAMNAVHV
ncbi:MAG: sulfite exporter TauE/SafE family protein [Phycisphaerales bacterium]|nr:sulfite exporter TauE/SafE family protein [Phycisphaerales bacterium]